MMNKNFKKAQKQAKMVPVILTGGIPAKVDPATITDEKWTHHHGKTADGQQVNSLKSMEIGQSLLIQGNTGPILSVTQAEAEVFAVQFLTDIGYSMKAPGSGH